MSLSNTTPKTLFLAVHSLASNHRKCASPKLSRRLPLGSLHTERGVQFDIGDVFFREESQTGRDLAILSAALYKQGNSDLRILEAMCGSGARSCRYLAQSKADFVWANDGNECARELIVGNLERVDEVSGFTSDIKRWTVTHRDANRLLSECYLNKDFFDLVDVDSFGSDSMFLRSAMLAVKLGGMLYLTSTDGYSSGGHRPNHSLAAYGAYVRPMPYSNEVGLRMLIGGAVREASILGYRIVPLFSYYSYHGPVFRVMLRLLRGRLSEESHYGFIAYCRHCGHSQRFAWNDLGKMACICTTGEVCRSLTVSGPLWTGPLHCASHVSEMRKLSEQWGWTATGAKTDLETTLTHMVDESDPRLPFGYVKVDEVAKRAKVNSPPLKAFMSALNEDGYATSRSHILPNAIKTDCPMAQCIRIAKELQV